MSSLFLLASFFLLVLGFVGEINLNAELITDSVDTSALRANNTSDELPVDLEFDGLFHVASMKCVVRQACANIHSC